MRQNMPIEVIFCRRVVEGADPYASCFNRQKNPLPSLGAVLCSVFDYRYCLIVSEARAGSSETVMVIFMLLVSQNLAAQAMNSSPK